MTHALPLLDAPRVSSDDAGIGALETPRGLLPLVALDVRGRIAGLLAQTSVRQTFRNAFDEPLEATYIFPLPDRAAVTRFRMTVAGRVVEGELKERGQAREEYEQAIQQGHRAAIAEEERSGVFTLRVGNIPPREEAVVELDMVAPLEVSDDEGIYRFPLVVAPRYTPGAPLEGDNVGNGVAPDTDQVPDASRVTPPVLLPGFPNPVRLSLEVELDPAGLTGGLSAVRSSLHTVVVDENGPPWRMRLQPSERLNRDFILRFPVAKEDVQTTLQCSTAARDKPGVFALTLMPQAMSVLNPQPREIVFVLDRSGSMSGWKMVAARRALGRMIDTLLAQDRFTVIAFDDQIETPEGIAKKSSRRKNSEPAMTLIDGSNRNRWRVLEWLGKIESRGGTEMGPALGFAMKCFSGAAAQSDRVLVVVTDGQVTGEDALLATLKSAAGERMPRVFTLGIDQAVNAGFLRRLAALGGGVCDLVETEDRLDEALEAVHRLIGQPVLTDVRLELLDFDGVSESLSPARTAGLYADRPLMIFGRHLSEKTSVRLRVHAVDADGKDWTAEVAAQTGPANVLMNLWGRSKVRELEDEYAAKGAGNQKLAEKIVKVSLESGVLSRFTAYVAIDRSEVVNQGGEQHKILQPVELPAGWDAGAAYEAMAYAAAPITAAMRMTRFRARASLSFGKFRSSKKGMNGPAASSFALTDDDELELVESADWSSNVVRELLGLFTGRRRKSINWSKLDVTLGEIRTAAERLKQAAAPAREDFADLIATLDALNDVLTQANHGAQHEVKRLAEDGQSILAAWPVSHNRVMAYLSNVIQILDKLSDPAQRTRVAFWK